jgi:hypothetical protein
MAGDLKDPAAIIGGLVVGKIVGDLLDTAINKTATVAGLRGISSAKELVKPAILVAAGLAAKQLLSNPLLKNVSLGVAAYGGAIAVNSIVNIPQLSSFSTATPPAVAGLGSPLYRPPFPVNALASSLPRTSGMIL